jgi:hypothetical protein
MTISITFDKAGKILIGLIVTKFCEIDFFFLIWENFRYFLLNKKTGTSLYTVLSMCSTQVRIIGKISFKN